jgi:hypothetical protein
MTLHPHTPHAHKMKLAKEQRSGMWIHAGRENRANWNAKFCIKSWLLQKILGEHLRYK